MKYCLFVVIMLLVSPMALFSQVEKGNKLFEGFHYSKAVSYYKKDVSNSDRRTSYEATKMLAECYIKMNNLEETIYWLNELERFEDSQPEVYFKLGTALRKNGQYVQAYEKFHKFNSYEPTTASLAYESYCKNIDQLERNSSVEIDPVEPINSAKSEFSPLFWNDDLLFTSDRNSKVDGVYGWTNFGYCKIFSSMQSDPFDVFNFPKKPMFMKSRELNQSLHSGPLAVSGNKRIYFLTRTESATKNNRERGPAKTIHLSLEYGSVVDNNFKAGKNFPYNNASYNVGHATLSNDGKMVIFSSDSPEGHGEGDLYVSYSSRGVWSEPENLGEPINGFGDEVFPFLVSDSVLYFSSTSHFGYGGLDVFMSTKNEDGSWSDPENVLEPINSSYDDFGFYMLEGGKQGYISSDRPGGKGADDIYAFQSRKQLKTGSTLVSKAEPEPVKEEIIAPIVAPVGALSGGNFIGRVLNEETNEPVEDALVFVLHPTSHNVNVYGTKSDGVFTVSANEGELLVMHVLKKNCSEAYYQFRVPRSNQWGHELPQVLYIKEGGYRNKVYTENILFDLDRDNLKRSEQKTLDEVVNYVKRIDGEYKIYLDAHTDVRASDDYNRDLSWRRAHQTMKYLVDHGISSKKIIIDWHGESDPKVGSRNSTQLSEKMHSKNRRTEISIEHMGEDHYPVSLNPDLYKPGDVLPMEIFPNLFFNITELEESKD